MTGSGDTGCLAIVFTLTVELILAFAFTMPFVSSVLVTNIKRGLSQSCQLLFLIGPKLDHCLPLSLFNWLTDYYSCSWDLNDSGWWEWLPSASQWSYLLVNIGWLQWRLIFFVILQLKFGQDIEAKVCTRFWSGILVKISVRGCDGDVDIWGKGPPQNPPPSMHLSWNSRNLSKGKY